MVLSKRISFSKGKNKDPSQAVFAYFIIGNIDFEIMFLIRNSYIDSILLKSNFRLKKA